MSVHHPGITVDQVNKVNYVYRVNIVNKKITTPPWCPGWQHLLEGITADLRGDTTLGMAIPLLAPGTSQTRQKGPLRGCWYVPVSTAREALASTRISRPGSGIILTSRLARLIRLTKFPKVDQVSDTTSNLQPPGGNGCPCIILASQLGRRLHRPGSPGLARVSSWHHSWHD